MTTADKNKSLDMNFLFYYGITNRLAHIGQSSMIISLLAGAMVYFIFQGQVSALLLNAWLGILIVFSLIRYLLIIRFWRMDATASNIRSWLRRYCLFVYASASCWGVLPLAEIFQTSDWARTFVVFVLTGISAGGMASLYPVLRAAIPYILIILLPLLYAMAGEENIDKILMAVMCGFYIIMLVRSTYVLNFNSNKAIRLDIENKELFRFLKKTHGPEIDTLSAGRENTAQ